LATTFVMEVSERYRLLVVVGAIDRGWHCYPQEKSEQGWNWMRDTYGATVALRCRQYLSQVREEHEGKCEVCDVRSLMHGLSFSDAVLVGRGVTTPRGSRRGFWNDTAVSSHGGSSVHTHASCRSKNRAVEK
jgi:hypothetical protein